MRTGTTNNKQKQINTNKTKQITKRQRNTTEYDKIQTNSDDITRCMRMARTNDKSNTTDARAKKTNTNMNTSMDTNTVCFYVSY